MHPVNLVVVISKCQHVCHVMYLVLVVVKTSRYDQYQEMTIVRASRHAVRLVVIVVLVVLSQSSLMAKCLPLPRWHVVFLRVRCLGLSCSLCTHSPFLMWFPVMAAFSTNTQMTLKSQKVVLLSIFRAPSPRFKTVSMMFSFGQTATSSNLIQIKLR